MQKKYMEPEMTVKLFSSTVRTSNGNPFDTSAVAQAVGYLNTQTNIKLQEVKVLEKTGQK